ncbi:MAG: formylglycine-generating enzyme family protein [Anaerolineae bacterium]|nr:formylglycine-generating enzyme family protein [Anaerolineae bacterium]
MVARMERDRDGIVLTEQLVHGQSFEEFVQAKTALHPDDARAAILAGQQLLEIGLDYALGSDDGERARRRIVSWLLGIATSPELREPALRVDAGNVLAHIGDPRFHGPELFCLPNDALLGFRHIPAGRFYMGTRTEDFERVMTRVNVPKERWEDWYSNEKNPQPETHTDEYYIAKYPVTVAQFKQFVAETQLKLRDTDALHGLDTHPVRYVTWHEAMKYCDWLTKKLKESNGLKASDPSLYTLMQRGAQATLPSEAEWERAARGDADMRVFSWDEDKPDPDRANYADTGIGDVSPVGCFPHGISPQGCLDMIGNVYEWTRSIYGPYPFDPGDPTREDLGAGNDQPRVLRGGSFRNRTRLARVALRLSDRPDSIHGEDGLRVVIRAHSSS